MKYVQSEVFDEWLRSYKCSGYYNDLERAESEAFRSSRSTETFKEAMYVKITEEELQLNFG